MLKPLLYMGLIVVLSVGSLVGCGKKAEAMVTTASSNVVPESASDNSVVKSSSSDAIDSALAPIDLNSIKEVTLDMDASGGAKVMTITSCEATGDKARVEIEADTPGVIASDDLNYYLFALPTYVTEITPDMEYAEVSDKYEIVQELNTDKKVHFSTNLNFNLENSRLYDKFQIAVLKDGEYVPISNYYYITNPEVLANYTFDHQESESKKGILVDPAKLETTELQDLGVKQATYNIPISNLLGETTNELYPTKYFNYNGKVYAFNGQVVAEYDYVFKNLTARNIIVTAILINNRVDAYEYMIHPQARSGDALYYAFNCAEEAGVEQIAATAAFLTGRYSTVRHGRVANWVIGNEINVRDTWNYMDYMDIQQYVEEYEKAVRVFYTAIKSVNANANIYICIDHQWNMEEETESSYNSKEFLDLYNESIKEKGDIDWGISEHPYPYPLTWVKFWQIPDGYCSNTLETDSEDSPIVMIGNIHVLTDYLQKNEYLNSNGDVRSVILSEIGFTSQYGEKYQSAAMMASYLIAENNPYIDAILYSRETDAQEEIDAGLAIGLSRLNGDKKDAYEVYKYMDTTNKDPYVKEARETIGEEYWGKIIVPAIKE